MIKHQWLRAIPLVVVAALAIAQAEAGEIRDRGGMFGAEAVKKAQTELDRTEKSTGIPVLIETIESIPGLEKDASSKVRRQAIDTLAERRAKEAGTEGVYFLLSKDDKVASHVLVRGRYETHLPREAREAVRDAMLGEFKSGKFDQGLLNAVKTLDRSLSSSPGGVLRLRPDAAVPAPGVQRRANAEGGKSGLGTLIMIGLGIFGVLLVVRVLGGLFGRSSAGYPGGMGMGGMGRPGMGPGPGYGAPGYGGGYGGRGGGGFFSGMLGGLGGALAGNWLYDQFSGRHGETGHSDASAYPVAGNPDPSGPGGDEFVGGNDDPGGGASWGEPDTGGDWGGGGDGGGDWGGGGGDWGGGGGDGGDW
jgi:hypothetical protein